MNTEPSIPAPPKGSIPVVPATLPLLLKPGQVAKLLNMGRSTLDYLRKQGGFGPSVQRIGGCVRYSTSEVLAWINAGCPSKAEWVASNARPPNKAYRPIDLAATE